jgi:PIN domain nuclease of toxin-antitoxin system
MRLLLDTHLVLWWLTGDKRLTADVRALIDDAGAAYVSHASLWEMAVKASNRKLKIDLAAATAEITALGFEWLDIRPAHLHVVAKLPPIEHRDPFDRLLVAQSVSEPLILLTTTRALERFGATVRVV